MSLKIQALRHLKWGCLGALCILFGISLHGDYKDAIGYNQLKTFLELRGLPLPTGSSVKVTQVEASTSDDNIPAYLPNAANSEFDGKSISDQSQGGNTSGHATTVGRFFYGNDTSIAPEITQIDVYEADDFLNEQGWATSLNPPVESSSIQSTSPNVPRCGRPPKHLFGWLNLRADPATGMWGKWSDEDGWLMPVNGFYRLTRGTYAQWGVPLPYPERAIDTVLAHANDRRHFGPGKATACFVLDIIHPLWLCLRQTDHRAAEARATAEFWLIDTIDRWRGGEGFSFETRGDATPGLMGTEMWLSIAWLCADVLGITTPDDHSPLGIHRPEPLVRAIRPVG